MMTYHAPYHAAIAYPRAPRSPDTRAHCSNHGRARQNASAMMSSCVTVIVPVVPSNGLGFLGFLGRSVPSPPGVGAEGDGPV